MEGSGCFPVQGTLSWFLAGRTERNHGNVMLVEFFTNYEVGTSRTRSSTPGKQWLKFLYNSILMLPCVLINLFLITKQMHQLFKFIHLQNSTCFGHPLCPSSGVFYCTFGIGKFHAGFWWTLPSRVRMELQFHPDCLDTIIKPAWNFTNAECRVENPWWRTQKMPETCRVL